MCLCGLDPHVVVVLLLYTLPLHHVAAPFLRVLSWPHVEAFQLLSCQQEEEDDDDDGEDEDVRQPAAAHGTRKKGGEV